MAAPPNTIQGYKLLKHLGTGYFGGVWKAEAPDGNLRAIKFVTCDGQAPEGGKTNPTENDFKALTQLKTIRFPRILAPERLLLLDNQLVIVMELASKNLWDRYKECRSQGLPGIPAEELRCYMEETAQAIDLMNEQYQLPHWDLKPRNILLQDNHVKIVDFGQVQDLQGIVGPAKGGMNPVYGAPEILDGKPGPHSDQYSLAVIYYELLTGQRLFPVTTLYQLITQHLHAQPDPSALPPADHSVLRRALAKKPDLRFPNCKEFVRALSTREKSSPTVGLDKPVAGPATAVPPSPISPGGKTAGYGDGGEGLKPSPARSIKPAPALPPIQEIEGEGVLVPALVIGVGRSAVAPLHRLRAALFARFGPLEHLPHIRWLFLDTDPAGITAAQEGPPGTALAGQDVFHCRLNITDNYVKGTSQAVPIASWLNPLMLYRIPRAGLTGGVRALGRLAFMDHYAKIVQRLKEELKTCTHPNILPAIAQKTRLGVRGNRPRVYIVANLAGGTGGGMFLDLAYLTRDLLRQLGYVHPEIIGLLFVPAGDNRLDKPPLLCNTFAALTELKHFSSPGVSFQADYGDPEGTLSDREPPFQQCFLLPASAEASKDRVPQPSELAGGFLFANLITPLGRTSEASRVPGKDAKPTSLAFHSFGMFRFSWPRRTFIQQAGRRLCRQLVEHWMAGVQPNSEEIRAWLTEQWSRRGLEPKTLTTRLKSACQQAFQKDPDEVLAAFGQQLQAQISAGQKLDRAAAEQVLIHLEQLAGRPKAPLKPGQPKVAPAPAGLLERTLGEATRAISAECEKQLADLCVCGLDEPRFRLAGAEFIIPPILPMLDQFLQKQEAYGKDFAETSQVAHERLLSSMENLEGLGGWLRRGSTVNDYVEMAAIYPKARYQELIHEGVMSILHGLRAAYPRYSGDIDMCRKRLEEFRRSLHSLQPFKESGAEVGPGISLLPVGCGTIEEAVKQFVQMIKPEELTALDAKMQEVIRAKLKSLVNVCLNPAAPKLLGELEIAMQEQAEAFVEPRLNETSTAAFFLKQYQQEQEMLKDIAGGFHQAAPSLTPPSTSAPEIHVLTVPAGPAGERFADLARQAMFGIELSVAAGTDDILFYRETPSLTFADLPQLGPRFQQAYQEMCALENFTPHSRCDIKEW
jgi:hypothetical protein